ELEGRPLEAFTFHDKGFVVSVGTRRGVADIAGITTGGRAAHLLKDAIEWEYRQSVKHLRGWDLWAGPEFRLLIDLSPWFHPSGIFLSAGGDGLWRCRGWPVVLG